MESLAKAISLFKRQAETGNLVASRLLVLLICAKFRGCRANDLCQLNWDQIQLKKNSVMFVPKNYKNMRYQGRWLFEIEKTLNWVRLIP